MNEPTDTNDDTKPRTRAVATTAEVCDGAEAEWCQRCNGTGSSLGYDPQRGIVHEDCHRCGGSGRVKAMPARSHTEKSAGTDASEKTL